ncbi:membrane-associated tyrosine- and threonine-specific cdc2-inhibitory kinase-like [Babylonia areolata]|uniref:membrane-associated tyrosine- and threonine-specific cdc2-inhibitory kinase-like n=1 Tax=Babylonia areolata TaxID=304850 RepID=UPI003FD3C429
MNSFSEEMDGISETDVSSTPVSSPEVQNTSAIFHYECEPKEYSTKREKLARNGCKTPGLDYAPPRPPVKSAPPVSRIFPRRKAVGPVSISFRKVYELDSPNYNKKVKKTYFEQLFLDHTKVGQGSFGEVFKAKFKDDGKEYAIKKSHKQPMTSGRRMRVLDEVKKYEMLPEHPNIVKFYLAWEEEDMLYIKLELCKESLSQYAWREHNISEEQIWTIFADLLFAVRHLHNHNMVHMDIKPENIFISYNGVCKLGDLGLVIHNCQPNSHAEEGDGRYLASEAINGNPGKPSDIFSLGVTILEMATDLDVPLIGNLWQALRNGHLPTKLLARHSETLQYAIEWMLLQDYKQRPTVENLLEHPELYPKFQEREKRYDFPQKIEVKPGMPPLADLAKERCKIRTEEEEKELEGAVGGSDEEMLDVSVANDTRDADEVDGLIPTCKEVLTKALLPQEPDVFGGRHARTEPLRRTHTSLTPASYFHSPFRQAKIRRMDHNDDELEGAVGGADPDEDGDGESKMESPVSRQPDGDRICAPRNLMTLFDAVGDDDDEDNVAIGAPDDQKPDDSAEPTEESSIQAEAAGNDSQLTMDMPADSENVMDLDESGSKENKEPSSDQGKEQVKSKR